eukprot:gene4545-6416_t
MHLPSFAKYEYIQIPADTSRFSRDYINDEPYGPVNKSSYVTCWEYGRWFLLILLIIQPFLFFELNDLKYAWVTSIFGLLACCLPSGGAPIAGGIIFIPALSILGLTPKQSVAFCSLSQAFGCGICAPMNWYAKDPGIIIRSSLIYTLPAGVFGLLISLFILPINEAEVQYYFSGFCLFLIITVIYGLMHDLTSQDQPVKFNFKSALFYITGSFIGGMIAGWIGIGIEKIYFLLATSYHKAELRRATVTAISIVGWLSMVSAYCHLFLLHDVPIVYVFCAFPGILIGSIIGPAYLLSKLIVADR